MENLKIIGTSHISPQSKALIRNSFKEFNPDIIALELDYDRFKTLLNNSNKSETINFFLIKRLGLKSFLFYIFGKWLQKSLSRVVNTEPGIEMREAILLAREYEKPIALIDQNINITLRKLNMCFNFGFFLRVLKDIFSGLFSRKRKQLGFDIRKIPDEQTLYLILDQFEQMYPCLYKVLVHDRNKYMARKIKQLITNFPDKKILVVVGAGHKKGLIELLKDIN